MSRARFKLAGLTLVALLAAMPQPARAWSGDPWGSISRDTIKALADAMIDVTWSPKTTFTNFQYGSTYRTYYQGTTYTGVAYSQNNPQENLAEFLNAVTNTTGGSVGYGNDCSGFVSICWKLPARKTTALFESQLGTYWTSLGDFGSAATAPLVMGDALNSPSDHIVLFLNYESTGIRTMEQTPNNAQRRVRSYSFLQPYRPIRRLLLADAPGIVTDAVSRVVDAGKPVSLRIEAAGTAPLAFQWFFNGAKLAGATSNQLAFNPAQLNHAGDYFCVVSNAHGMATSRVVSLTVFPPQATVFLDTFDTDTSTGWQLNRSSSDTRATFAWDYSAMGIPPAPNAVGGTTRGLRMEANLTAGVAAALCLSPKNQSFPGDYRLRFDMWINANGPFPAGGTGSTEHLTAGVGTRGDRVHWTGTGSTADAAWFAVDGEGGASDTSTTIGDFCALLGTALQNPSSGVYRAGTETNAKGNVHPYYAAAFGAGRAPPALQQANYPQQTGALAAGTVGFAWREVIVARRGNRVDWAIDGVHLASITNATLPGSNVFVGYWDSYASLSDNPDLSFGLVDNVRVEVPVVGPVTPQCTTALRLPDGRIQFNGRGAPGRYTIECSTNLAVWEAIGNVWSTDGFFEWIVPSTDAPQCFYRVRWSP
ncbi:MAG: immunoglobulin domain-containing protein [Verrucomicrobiae bacterium]|nr:immunoglobulin domain-containing protein [Verrucomicrobiae bacterium]